MPDPFLIVSVTEGLALAAEPMGGKEKFWYRPEGRNRDWLFKHPRPGTGEHWAEKLAAEIAEALHVQHGRVELAQFGDVRGTVSVSFLDERHSLFHGNQALSEIVGAYDTNLRFRQSNHTIDNILTALKVFVNCGEESLLQFSKYIVLDALIGNTDRHHENWALIEGWGKPEQDGLSTFNCSLAPSFDHASSLGRELSDRRREQFLKEDRVGAYSERAVGGIYWAVDEPGAPSPLQLVRLCAGRYPDLVLPALRDLNLPDEESLRGIVNRIPADWMSSPAREFAHSLLCYNLAQLRELL